MSNAPAEHVPTDGTSKMQKTEYRFWSKVIRGPLTADCWIWIGAIADDGYGRFYLEGASVRPHRYSLAQDMGLPHH